MADDEMMKPAETASYLKTSVAYLAHMRCYGMGPKFSKDKSRRVFYRRADVEKWAADRHARRTLGRRYLKVQP